MPQVYRRRSEYVQRPPPAPRRRSILTPQPVDADDSIVLSDLVRTGEASRLRRRGALRLDHGQGDAVRAALTVPSSAPSGGTTAWAINPPTLMPSAQIANSPWVEVSADEEFFGGLEWREWSTEEGGGAANGGSAGVDETSREPALEEDDEEGYMLFCGGISQDDPEVSHGPYSPFKPSPLPVPSTSSSPSVCGGNRRTNGCGAIVHMRAFPQRSRGVWVGKAEATESVVGLESSYFERSVVARMMQSACGCLREGIGCAVCGNPLGTRYLPCQAASEGIFSNRSTRPARDTLPRYPSGPQYWRCRTSPRRSPESPTSTRPSSNFYVYTFFADHVSSSPPCAFPEQPKEGEVYPNVQLPYSSRPATPPQPPSSYGYRYSASPQPISQYRLLPPEEAVAPSTSILESTIVPPYPSSNPPRTPTRRTMPVSEPELYFSEDTGRLVEPRPVILGRDAPVGMQLDPDGVLIDADSSEEPNSPDKTGPEGMIWTGR
ncbi:uncharacterized protein LAESUDRAFT_812728 [Laetiporus sulphureus 93-53]|uniref:Uncharacterized protein n=1 Tax=Laetiporus sulphureus 93-53 TaxID=1314785 RepID=A0A165E8E8_9APHY|nr:uncharacterized protein LAESUDRAFT_812728 [Laetiporus sulphureus 93-53]KZT06453.1 hypothetical protein LAESUDRAFT_812728 [Laetiporus sulphureus 93-53]